MPVPRSSGSRPYVAKYRNSPRFWEEGETLDARGIDRDPAAGRIHGEQVPRPADPRLDDVRWAIGLPRLQEHLLGDALDTGRSSSRSCLSSIC
jgi:hypothetical protein